MPTTRTTPTTRPSCPSAQIIRFPNLPQASHPNSPRTGQHAKAFAELTRIWAARRACHAAAVATMVIKFPSHATKGRALT